MTLKITPTDDSKETEGTWGEYLGVKLKIARSNKPKYTAELARRLKIFSNKRNIDPDQAVTETCKALAKHILVDWKNLKMDDKDIPYSSDLAYELLKNDPDCRDYVIEFADDSANFYKEVAEEIVKK